MLGEFEEAVLLTVLRLGEGAYGASILRDIEGRSERAVSVGALHTTLERLERKGYVSSRVGEATSQRGGRRKKYYAIEAAGASALKAAYRLRRRMVQGLEDQLGSL